MSAKGKLEPRYTDDYYRMEKLIKDEVFQCKLSNLFSTYEKMGCPVPSNGFKTYDQYLSWFNGFWKQYAKIRKDDTNEEDLLLIPGYWADEILSEFGFDPKNRKYFDFLESYMFLGKKHLEESAFMIRWIRNEKTDQFELFIQLFPHTKREHLTAFWKEIVRNQKLLPGYIGKSKAWIYFNRDLDIYTAYQKIKSGRPENRARKYTAPLDREVLLQMSKKYSSLKLGDIRKAVTRISKLESKPL